MINDLILIFWTWALTYIWQLLAWPVIFKLVGKKMVDGGWAWGRIAGWLISSFIIWSLAHLKIPINNQLGVWLVLLVMSLVGFNFFKNQQNKIINFIKANKRLILLEEALFLFGFLVMSLIRSFHPNILDLEKFMDVGFMISYLKSPILPVADMWLAGETINYYTFGHFMGSIATQLWGVDMRYGFNLLLGLIAGLLLIEVFSLVANLSAASKKKFSQRSIITAGLVGTLITAIGGNTHAIWYFLKNLSFKKFWYPDSTRFIENTIHEFPVYSFIVSDLHAHVWSLPLVLVTILLIWLWFKALVKEGRQQHNFFATNYSKYSWAVGSLIGVLLMTSAWDMAIYSLLLSIVGLILLYKDQRFLKPLLVSAINMVACAIFVSLFWWINFESISKGVRMVTARSPLWQLVVLWAGHVSLSAVAITATWFQQRKLRLSENKSIFLFMTAIVITAWLLLILPEIIFFKDIYPNHPRANTMFKFTYQAFIMMGVGIGWLAGFLQQRPSFFGKKLIFIKLGLVIFILSVAVYPYFGFRDYYGRWENYQGLDGLAWLERDNPDDYQGVLWLQQHERKQSNIVEAVGESYTTFARVSTFTGLPTILGWRVHEWLWRGGFDIPAERTAQVEKIYQSPLSPESRGYLTDYEVKYIFVGDKERETYKNLDINGLKKLGPIVFQSGETFIIQRP